jgi:predicted sulfurtransferase
MYCTGGIRCERASALLDQMKDAAPNFNLEGDICMVRGGIERYMKTFPEVKHPSKPSRDAEID